MQPYPVKSVTSGTSSSSPAGTKRHHWPRSPGAAAVPFICCLISCPLGILVLSPFRGGLRGWCGRSSGMAEQQGRQQRHTAALPNTFPLRAVLPPGSFRATAASYAALLRARMFKRQQQQGSEESGARQKDHAGAAAAAATTGAARAGAAEAPPGTESPRAASAAAGGGPAAGSLAPTAAAQQSLFGEEDFRRLHKTQTWKHLLDYPQELFRGEYEAKEVPKAFELDWASLSTKKVPGFEPRKPAPWMHPNDVTAADVAPSYVNVDDRLALEAAAWCSNPHAFETGRGVAGGTTAHIADQDSSAASAGGEREAATAVTQSEMWDERLEKQRDAGSLHLHSIKLFTPVREKASRLPLNPILFTGSPASTRGGNIQGGGLLPALHSQHVKEQQLRSPQRHEQPQDSEDCKVIPLPHVRVQGRGILGKWGSNHAADVVLTASNPSNNKLQVVLIRRTDGSRQYAFPGGFVDDGDFPPVLSTAVREFLEEAVHFADLPATEAAAAPAEGAAGASTARAGAETQERAATRAGTLQAALGVEDAAPRVTGKGIHNTQLKETLEALKALFGPFVWDASSGKVSWESEEQIRPGNIIYAGYVDDVRNTDNAWIETVALHWHIPSSLYSRIHLEAGDDAAHGSAAFYDIRDDPRLVAENVDPLEDLYGSHSGILQKTLEKHFPELL